MLKVQYSDAVFSPVIKKKIKNRKKREEHYESI